MLAKSPEQILREVFGYESFRTHQKEIIDAVLQKQDALAIMPTGGGKSLCYQIPAILFPGLTVVVSPLISLMKDQVMQLTEFGVAACVLNSSLSQSEYQANVQRVKNGEVNLLYVAPETLLQSRIQQLLQQIELDCLTVDEAPCISEWGHDFRPEYRQIAALRARFPRTACLALTATATPRVQQDIAASLQMQTARKFVASFDRENLFLQVARKGDTLQQLLEFLQNHRSDNGIIYCFSRDQVDELAATLQDHDFSALPYHAGMEGQARTETQEKFLRDQVQIIVATVAFGMGINKSNVRFVVHYDLPKNIESYYQEIGRAGRDGLPAHCLLFFGYGDVRKIRYFFKEKTPAEQQIAESQLQALISYAEFTGCRRKPVLTYFGQEYSSENCNMCDRCTSGDDDVQDLTIPAQKFISCVIRTREMFGAAHIVDVLRGSKNRKIKRFGHDRLSTYDIGAELTKKQWMFLANQLISHSFLLRDAEHGNLRVAPKAKSLLAGQERFESAMIDDQEKFSPTKRIIDMGNYDRDLFEKLRALRRKLAETANVPPFVIFSDKSLVDMAANFPQSQENFLMMHGVGKAKFEKYGLAFIEAIHRYCLSRDIREKPLALRQVKAEKRRKKPRKFTLIGEAFNRGMTVEQIAEQEHIKTQTVIQHLYDYLDDGGTIRPYNFDKDYPELATFREEIAAAFKRHGAERLTPVYEALHGKVDWELLRVFKLQQLIDAHAGRARR